MTQDPYSRIVAWAKVCLPLGALAILSLLFLLAEPQNTDATITYAEVELNERLETEQITRPSYAGVTQEGNQIVVRANEAGKLRDGRAGTSANALSANILMQNGTEVSLIAPLGEINEETQMTRLQGGVIMETSHGVVLETEAVTSALDRTLVASAGRVTGQSPFGSLEAGELLLSPNGEGQNVLHLKNGVRLLYTPK